MMKVERDSKGASGKRASAASRVQRPDTRVGARGNPSPSAS